jgi:hypothetical protein
MSASSCWVNRAVGQSFYRALQRFTAETVLEREHAPDADRVSENAAMLGFVRSTAAPRVAGFSPQR